MLVKQWHVNAPIHAGGCKSASFAWRGQQGCGRLEYAGANLCLLAATMTAHRLRVPYTQVFVQVEARLISRFRLPAL